MERSPLDFDAAPSDASDEGPSTLAAIDRGIADADAERTVSLEEARKLTAGWFSEFESLRKP